MKWLATVLCLLALSVATLNASTLDDKGIVDSEDPLLQEPRTTVPIIPLPFLLTCAPKPALEVLVTKKYDEIPMLEGSGVIIGADQQPILGTMKFFISRKKPHSYTVLFESQEIQCFVITGDNLAPVKMPGIQL